MSLRDRLRRWLGVEVLEIRLNSTDKACNEPHAPLDPEVWMPFMRAVYGHTEEAHLSRVSPS